MLNIFWGDMPEAIYNTEVYFKNVYEDEWFSDSLVREMVEDVDDSVVLDGTIIDSPIIGKIPPTRLSGGVKTLILMLYEPDKVLNASACGDNCAKWILKIAPKRDITINLRHILDFGNETFEVRVLNNDQMVYNMQELVMAAVDYV